MPCYRSYFSGRFLIHLVGNGGEEARGALLLTTAASFRMLSMLVEGIFENRSKVIVCVWAAAVSQMF